MFQSKLNLLIYKEEKKSLIDRDAIRQSLFEFLKADLVLFLHKILHKKCNFQQFSELPLIHREIKRILRELGVFNFNTPGKDLERSTIIERWFASLSQKESISTRKMMNYFNIYRNRLYSLSKQMPYSFSDLNNLTRKMLISENYAITFNEIYQSELELKNELMFTLLRQVSPINRLEYLISKEMILNLSDDFVRTLHEEFSNHFKESLAKQEKIHSDMIKKNVSIDTEIHLAKKFYAKTLHHPIPENNEKINITTWFSPYIYIGGDFYRIIEINKDVYAVFLADIAGHGISAALFLNTLNHSFEDNKQYLQSPAEFIIKLNSSLYGKTGDYFITGMTALINTKTAQITYASAGHTKGFLYTLKNEKQTVKFLRPTGSVLGIFQENTYREDTLYYTEDSRLVLYTDGLTELYNDKDKLLGERGLLNILDKVNHLDTSKSLIKIKHELNYFLGKNTPDDDICLILIDLFKKKANPR